MTRTPRRQSDGHALNLTIGHRQVSGRRLHRNWLGDVFHLAMSMSWPRLLGCYAAAFVAINLVFSTLYWVSAGSVIGQRAPDWLDLLFFSVEVFGTVSFGGLMPGSLYGHTVASFEILLGITSFAFMTGLTFARFTRAKAELVFARHPVIHERDGQLMLVTRVANNRHNFMTDAYAKAWIIASDLPGTPNRGRRFQRVALVRDENPLLALSWLLYHVIDESSPLYGMSHEEMVLRDVNVMYIVSGHDEDYAQEVRARHMYLLEDIRWHHVYEDTVLETSPGQVTVDFTKFHETRPQPRTGP